MNGPKLAILNSILDAERSGEGCADFGSDLAVFSRMDETAEIRASRVGAG